MSMFDEFATKFNNRDGAEVQRKIQNLPVNFSSGILWNAKNEETEEWC